LGVNCNETLIKQVICDIDAHQRVSRGFEVQVIKNIIGKVNLK